MVCWWILALAVANVEYPFFYISQQIYDYGGGTLVQTITQIPDVYVYRVETAYLAYLFFGLGILQMLFAVSLILQFLAEPIEEAVEE
jgi:hypothetical protein